MQRDSRERALFEWQSLLDNTKKLVGWLKENGDRPDLSPLERRDRDDMMSYVERDLGDFGPAFDSIINEHEEMEGYEDQVVDLEKQVDRLRDQVLDLKAENEDLENRLSRMEG